MYPGTLTRFLLLAGLAGSAMDVAALNLTTEDYPPFNLQTPDKKVAGISTEIVQEAMKRAGVTANVTLLPWERALDTAKTQADACVYSAVRTPEREKLFKWVGPLVGDEVTLFAKADSTIKLSGPADAKKYKVGGYNGDAYGDIVEKQGIKVERVVSDVQNLPKLESGRIDLWISGARSGLYKAAHEGNGIKLKAVLTIGDPKDSQMWLACNPGVPDDTVKKLNDAVQAVKKDGTSDKIAKKYQ